MAKAPVIIDGTATVLPSVVDSPRPLPIDRRRALVVALSRTMDQVDRVAQTATGVKATLRQIREAVDPREVAGGFVGLTAGEVIGGAVGGTAGAAVGGPPGAMLGAEVGAFTAGMLGLKLGMDAVQDLKDAQAAEQGHPAKPAETDVGATLGRKLQGRSGEIVGLTSGATIGLVVAGPAGGLVGAVVGESLGGRIRQGLRKPTGEPSAEQTQLDNKQAVAQWLDRFGKNTAGEAATVLVAGSVGSVFGLSGLKVGQRIGRVVSKRVEWDKLGRPTAEKPAIDAESPPTEL